MMTAGPRYLSPFLPVGLHDDGGAEVLVSVPPVGGAGGAAARAQNALVHAVLQGQRSAKGQQEVSMVKFIINGQQWQ